MKLLYIASALSDVVVVAAARIPDVPCCYCSDPDYIKRPTDEFL